MQKQNKAWVASVPPKEEQGVQRSTRMTLCIHGEYALLTFVTKGFEYQNCGFWGINFYPHSIFVVTPVSLPFRYFRSDRQEIDPSLFTVEDAMDDTAVRLPGSIEGHPFTISNCLKANIFLFDHMNSVTINDCKDCTIFLGPTKGR